MNNGRKTVERSAALALIAAALVGTVRGFDVPTSYALPNGVQTAQDGTTNAPNAEATPANEDSASTDETAVPQAVVPEWTTAPGVDGPRVIEAPPVEEAIKIKGFANAGYFGNVAGANRNGDVSANAASGGALNTLGISVSKAVAPTGGEADWGFGVDFMFGEDTRLLRVQNGLDENWDTGSDGRGNPTYGFAMPQLYGAVGVENWTLTAGHFFSPFRPNGALFYSRSLATVAMPKTHTGATLTYSGIEKITATVGLVNGLNQGFDDEVGGTLFAAVLAIKPNDMLAFTYAFGGGNVEDRVLDDGSRSKTTGGIHSWTFDVTPDDRWTWTTRADYIAVDSLGAGGTAQTILGEQVAYRFNPCWKAGTRVEWQRAKPSAAEANERVALSVGANWNPNASKYLTIRPEIRYDNSSWDQYGKNADRRDQLCLGFDAGIKF